MGLRSRLKDTLGGLLGGTQDTERRPQPYRSPVASIIDDARAQERAQAEERARAEEAARAQRFTPSSPPRRACRRRAPWRPCRCAAMKYRFSLWS